MTLVIVHLLSDHLNDSLVNYIIDRHFQPVVHVVPLPGNHVAGYHTSPTTKYGQLSAYGGEFLRQISENVRAQG